MFNSWLAGKKLLSCVSLFAVLLPGVFAASIAASGVVTATGFCPPDFVCPGGKPTQTFDPSNPSSTLSETTVQACPDGMWTKEFGSASLEDCLTPPGFFTAAGETVQCPPGSYRPDWKAAGQAADCVPCGQGLLAEGTDRVTKHGLGGNLTQEVAVSTSPEDCCEFCAWLLHTLVHCTTSQWPAVCLEGRTVW